MSAEEEKKWEDIFAVMFGPATIVNGEVNIVMTIPLNRQDPESGNLFSLLCAAGEDNDFHVRVKP